ncbi:MAG: CYTH domain-containing protein [Nanoarchaeota archaeon]
MVHEVELRSFISEQKYQDLMQFFSTHARRRSHEEQETHYFDCGQDLRIQKSTNYAKVWLKKGNMHDDSREEIEVKVEPDQFSGLQELFAALGYTVDIKWFRTRDIFEWDGISVMLDHTRGYGHILEMECMVEDAEEIEETRQRLRAAFERLDVSITAKETFAERYEYYRRNWQELV